MLDAKTIRKLLMTAVAVAFATTPAAAEGPAQNCWYTEQHQGLFCNDGSDIHVCETPTGCEADCGSTAVDVDC